MLRTISALLRAGDNIKKQPSNESNISYRQSIQPANQQEYFIEFRKLLWLFVKMWDVTRPKTINKTELQKAMEAHDSFIVHERSCAISLLEEIRSYYYKPTSNPASSAISAVEHSQMFFYDTPTSSQSNLLNVSTYCVFY